MTDEYGIESCVAHPFKIAKGGAPQCCRPSRKLANKKDEPARLDARRRWSVCGQRQRRVGAPPLIANSLLPLFGLGMAAYNVNSGVSFVGEAIGVFVEACSILSILI